MNYTRISENFLFFFAVIFCLNPVSFAEPLGTTFTYQGRLIDVNEPADGFYDLQFKLFDAEFGGNQLNDDINKPDLDVIDGYFIVELDFNDANSFNGDARWIEIGVRPGDLNDPNLYTVLIPRQAITPTPYALYAKNVPVSADSDWIISDNNTYSSITGNVGIGTSVPATKLDVDGVITSAGGNSNNWNTAYNNKIIQDSLNGFIKSDGSGGYSAIEDNSANWNAAYNWGRSSYNVKTYGATGDGVTDDTNAFAVAITAAAGGQIYVPDGTYMLNDLGLTIDTCLDLSPRAVLKHKATNYGQMINFVGANTLRIRGGTLDGNKESFEDVNRWPHLIAAYLESGKKIEVQDTHFTNTRNNAFYVMNFGGTFLIDNCEFTHMSEGRPGRPSDALTVVTGEPNKPGFMRVSNCKFIADVPAYEDGMSPGGMFLAADNSSTLEVEGCYFYGIGQFFDQYDIASIHVYPRWNGVRIANNYFEQCAFASIVVKSVHNFVCTGNVISNGQTSVNFLRSEGAIAYDPGYQPFHEDEFVTHPRAVIANNIIDNPGCETDVGKVACISVHGTLQSHADDVIIANNVLKNGGYGIYIVYPDDITIANNIIEGAADGNAGIEHGILFVNAFGEIIISGNRIITPNGMGLYCVAEADSSKWYVIGNTFNHSSPDAYACTLRGVAYAKFSGNTFNATEGYSLIIKGGCGGACPVGWLSWDNSNIILAGPTTFNWPQISKASGFLSGTLSPYNLVVPAEIGTLYRQTSGTNNVLWQSMGTTKTSWVQMATSNIIPPVDSSTAVQIRKANGTASIVNVDTINSRVGIGTTSPARALHINDAMRVQPRSTAPSNPAEGDVYMDSTTHKLMVYDGNAWQACW